MPAVELGLITSTERLEVIVYKHLIKYLGREANFEAFGVAVLASVIGRFCEGH